MIITVTPLSYSSIHGIAIKSKDEKIGIPIEIKKGDSLTIIEEEGKLRLGHDSRSSYSSIVIHRGDTKSELIIETADKPSLKAHDLVMLTPEKEFIFDIIDKNRDRLIEVSDFIHNHPELGNEEFKAYEILTRELEKEGFKIDYKVLGLDTAFVANYTNEDKSGPVIGILAEYDALEGLGHGCGHNIIAAAALGSAIGLSKGLGELAATIKVYGTPAEETVGAKIMLAEKGLFDDCDVILMTHPSDYTTAGVTYLAMQDLKIVFEGKPAHAAKAYNGVSALSAVINFFNGTDSLRQFVKPDVRLHGIVSYGGDAPNVVPEKAEILYSVRAKNSTYLREIVKRVEDIAKGASLMSGAKFSIQKELIYENNIVVPLLSDLILNNAELVGVERIQEAGEAGSTDFGNVSHRLPAECLDIEFVPLNTPCHSHEWVEAGNSKTGHEAVIKAAKAMAATAFDLISHKELLQQVKDQFNAIKEQ